MALADKKTILSAQDWETEEFDVPTWGTIKIRSLSAKERLTLASRFSDGELSNDEALRFYVELIALSMIDDNGHQLFDSEEDIEKLQNKSWPRLEFVARRVMQFNSMNSEGAEKN